MRLPVLNNDLFIIVTWPSPILDHDGVNGGAGAFLDNHGADAFLDNVPVPALLDDNLFSCRVSGQRRRQDKDAGCREKKLSHLLVPLWSGREQRLNAY